MASAYSEYVQNELALERALDFTKEEKEEISKVVKILEAKNAIQKWHGLSKEIRRTIVRGLWPRKNRTDEIANATQEIYDWRKRKNMDSALKTRHSKHDLYHSAWPSYVSGEDIYGHWIQFEKIREINVKCLDLVTMEELFECRTQHLEAQMEIKRRISKRLGTRVCRAIYMLDLKDLSVSKQFTPKVKNILQPLFQISGDMYPDSLWSLWILNAPMSFRMVWRIILPWVDPLVRPKIRLLGGSKQYLQAMDQAGIPLESVPVDLGGKCETRPAAEIIDALIEDPETQEEFTFNRLPGKGKIDILADGQAEMEARREYQTKENRLSMVEDENGQESIYNEDEVILEGYLLKMGAYNKAWKKRYFVLTPQNLFYFPEKPLKAADTQLRGKIELYMVSKVAEHEEENGDPSKSPNEEGALFRFDIITPFRTYYLRLDDGDPSERKDLLHEWIVNVSDAAAEEVCSIDFKDGGTVGVNHVRSGFLYKRGAFNTMYRRRYFVLTGNGLYYFSGNPTEKNSVLKGKIRLSKILHVEKESKQKNRFNVQTKLRVYHLRAKDEADAEAWMASIKDAFEKYKEHDTARTKISIVEPLNEVRRIPFVDQVAVIEAESNFEGSGMSIIKNIKSLVISAIEAAADLNILVDNQTGERLKGNAVALADVLTAAAGRVTSMFSMVFAPRADDEEEILKE